MRTNRKTNTRRTLICFTALSLFTFYSATGCLHKRTSNFESSDSEDIANQASRTLTREEIKKACLENNPIDPGLTIDQINLLSYDLALQRGEKFPEMATPTMRLLEKKKGRFGGDVYIFETRNLFTNEPIYLQWTSNMDPMYNSTKLRCIGSNRDAHGYLIGMLINNFHPSLQEVLQVKLISEGTIVRGIPQAAARMLLPSPTEFDRSLTELRKRMPSWASDLAATDQLAAGGRQTSAESYVNAFLISGSLPQGSTGWMYFHDLLVHNLTMILVPQNYGRFFKGLINQGRVFARFVASQKGTPKELPEQIYTRLADIIDSWSAKVATFTTSGDANLLIWQSTRPSDNPIILKDKIPNYDDRELTTLGARLKKSLTDFLPVADLPGLLVDKNEQYFEFILPQETLEPYFEAYGRNHPDKIQLLRPNGKPGPATSLGLGSDLEMGRQFTTHLERLSAATQAIAQRENTK